MSDCIFIENIETEAIIGVFDWERTTRQPVIFDLTIYTNFAKPCESDDLNDAIDYQNLTETLVGFVAETQFNLLETLVEKTADFLLTGFDIPKVTIRVYKPKALPSDTMVSLKITRSAESKEQDS